MLDDVDPNAQQAAQGWYYKKKFIGYEAAWGPYTSREIEKLIEDKVIDGTTMIKYSDRNWRHVYDYFPKMKTQEKLDIGTSTLVLLGILVVVIGVYIFQFFFHIDISSGVAVQSSFVPQIRWHLKPADGPVPAKTEAAFTKEGIMAVINNVRVSSGLPALSENSLLNAVAEERTRNAAERLAMNQPAQPEEKPHTIAQRVGYNPRQLAENILNVASAQKSVLEGMMQNVSQRQNILSAEVSDVGIAVAKVNIQGGDRWIIAQVFGSQMPVQAGPLVQTGTQCVPPKQSMRAEIEQASRELEEARLALNASKSVLDIEKERIEGSRNLSTVEVQNYNERVQEYNRAFDEVGQKRDAVTRMVTDWSTNNDNYENCLREMAKNGGNR